MDIQIQRGRGRPLGSAGKSIKVGAVTYKSIATAARAASKRTGISYITIYMRMRNGWTAADAVNVPVRRSRRQVPSDTVVAA